MPLADYSTDSTRNLKGLHLYHYGMSNCSQRVRLVMELKSLEWTSHYVELPKLEHLENEFQSINPRGVVPVLVHDGQIVTESLDIIAYLDEQFPEPPLLNSDDLDAGKAEMLLEATQDVHKAVKILTYEFLFKKVGLFNDERVEFYSGHQGNQENVSFLQEFFSGFSQERIDDALQEMHGYCSKIDAAAEQSEYLTGSRYSLADIAVIVNVHRFYLLNLDVARYDHMRRWYEMIADTTAFQNAIMAPEYAPVNGRPNQ